MARETLTAPKGKIYKRGNDYGYQVHVGVNDDPNEWKLVDESEMPTEAAPIEME